MTFAEIEKVQRRATKIAHVMKGKSYEDRLKLLNLTTLEERRIRGDSIQWYKIINGIEEVRWISEPRLGHPRAGERGKYILDTVKNCQQREKFFTNRAPEAWNSLPDSVVEAGSVDSFKRLFDDHFQGCHSPSSSCGGLHKV